MDPGSLLPLAFLVVIFYFLLIRPQQKRLKQHQALLSSLALGDEVVTVGGIYGMVRRLGDDQIVLEVADNTLVRVSRQAISRKVEPEVSEDETEAPAAEKPEIDAS
jgi:preprotein translocase subunit YajC